MHCIQYTVFSQGGQNHLETLLVFSMNGPLVHNSISIQFIPFSWCEANLFGSRCFWLHRRCHKLIHRSLPRHVFSVSWYTFPQYWYRCCCTKMDTKTDVSHPTKARFLCSLIHISSIFIQILLYKDGYKNRCIAPYQSTFSVFAQLIQISSILIQILLYKHGYKKLIHCFVLRHVFSVRCADTHSLNQRHPLSTTQLLYTLQRRISTTGIQ